MTTELPSGDISTPLKPTALKNSSSVSFGLSCARTASVQLRMTGMTKAGFRIFIGPRREEALYNGGFGGSKSGNWVTSREIPFDALASLPCSGQAPPPSGKDAGVRYDARFCG